MDEAGLSGHLDVPQIQISTLGPCSQSGGMGGMPLQTGDPAVEGAGHTVEMIRGQRADKGLLETLNETIDFIEITLKNKSKLNVNFLTIMLFSYSSFP